MTLTGTFQKLYSWFGAKNTFYGSTNYFLGQKGEIYVDTDKPSELYRTIPQIRAIIGKKKNMFANVEFILKDINGKEINNAKSDQFYLLMQNPNVMQSFNAFLCNQLEQLDVYGTQFIYKNKVGMKDYPSALWNVSPAYMELVLTGKSFDQTSIDGIISYYNYVENNKKRRFETNQILLTKHDDLDSPIVGKSPLAYLKHPLSNIDLAYKHRNSVMANKGAIGILSGGGSDASGSVPLKKEDKEKVENAHRNTYGLDEGQMKILITEAQLKWSPISYPTKDLMLFEEVKDDTLTLIDALGMHAHLFAGNDNTFENIKTAIKMVYSDTIQPYADSFTQALGAFLNVEGIHGKGTYIEASYDHIQLLEDDKKTEADTFKTTLDAISQAVELQLINQKQALQIITNLTGITI